jgi:D-alanyl-D-alanine carboxypeptidase
MKRRGGVVAMLALAISFAAPAVASAGSQDGLAVELRQAVNAQFEKRPVRSALYGVWVDGRPVVSGALGESRPGVPATKADHFRIGNVTESFTVTRLLQLVDEGRVSLDDPLSNWLPNVPGAEQVTLGMLARSISGYHDYVRTDRFNSQFDEDPFQRWRYSELVRLGVNRGFDFTPGTSWAFSDTNFLLLGKALERIAGEPVNRQLDRAIARPLGLDETRMSKRARIARPVMNGYTSERGRYEKSTGWSPSWAMYTGNMTSTLGDLGRWANALFTGSLLSAESHALQFGPQNAGLGPLTEDRYYAMGSVVDDGWIFNNPQLLGYNGVVAYSPAKRTAVVVFTTMGPKANPDVAYASAFGNAIGEIVDPEHPLNLSVCPRPPC